MKLFFAAKSPRSLLSFAEWGALIVLILASASFLFDLINRSSGWIIGLFRIPDELWKECSRWF
jgi:hypothetical protein